MKPQEAINYLSAMEEDYADEDGVKQTKALKLGIEALKRFNLWRECGDDVDTSPLPGETEEVN